MEEPAEIPIDETPAGSEAHESVPATPEVVTPAVTTQASEEGYSIVQKGLFFGVLVGCFAAYLRVNSRSYKRSMEKSMA